MNLAASTALGVGFVYKIEFWNNRPKSSKRPMSIRTTALIAVETVQDSENSIGGLPFCSQCGRRHASGPGSLRCRDSTPLSLPCLDRGRPKSEGEKPNDTNGVCPSHL